MARAEDEGEQLLHRAQLHLRRLCAPFSAPLQVADGGYAAGRWERFPRLTRRRSKPTRRQRVRAIATSAASGGAK
jgi:hypothetical protein